MTDNGNKIIKILSLFKKYSFKEIFKLIKKRYIQTKSNDNIVGFVDRWDGENLSGWVINDKLDIASVKIIIEGEKEPITVMANQERKDVKKATGINKLCGYSVPLKIENSKKLLIQVVEEKTGKELHHSSFYSDKYFS